MHQVLSPYGYLPVDPKTQDYEREVEIQRHRDYFWVLAEYCILSYGWVSLNINYNMFISFSIYIIADTIRVSFKFSDVIMDYALLVFVISLALAIHNYNRVKFSKQFFLQQKKIKALHLE